MTLRRMLRGLLLPALMLVAVAASAQQQTSDKAEKAEKGYTFDETFQGSSNRLGQVFKSSTSVGYDYNKYFGVSIGVPIYFVHVSTTTTTTAGTGAGSHSGIGDVFVDLNLTVDNPLLNYASTLTGTVPTGSTSGGLSTGRVTANWNNHFDHDLWRIRPFVNAGVANSISDTHFFTRPFTTLGLVGLFEGGGTIKVFPWVRLGASLYDDLPSGNQKVYSKLFKMSGTTSGKGFKQSRVTTGTADIAKDNGVAAWLSFFEGHMGSLEVGYQRSVPNNLDTFSFVLDLDFSSFLRKATGR